MAAIFPNDVLYEFVTLFVVLDPVGKHGVLDVELPLLAVDPDLQRPLCRCRGGTFLGFFHRDEPFQLPDSCYWEPYCIGPKIGIDFRKERCSRFSDSAGQREVSNRPVGVGTEAQCARMADNS